MKFEISSQDKAFLTMASKIISGNATASERSEFEQMIRSQPRYTKQFQQLNRELRHDNQNQFWVSVVRVILKVADPAEVKMIESLKETNPDQFEQYQEAVEFLVVLASREKALKTMKLQPMPTHVREKALADLKASRERRGRR